MNYCIESINSKAKEKKDLKTAGYQDSKTNLSKTIDVKRNEDPRVQAKISENEFKRCEEAQEQSELISETLHNLLDFYKSFDTKMKANEGCLMTCLSNLEEQKVLILNTLDKINGQKAPAKTQIANLETTLKEQEDVSERQLKAQGK